MSHTVTVDIKVADMEASDRAFKNIGARLSSKTSAASTYVVGGAYISIDHKSGIASYDSDARVVIDGKKHTVPDYLKTVFMSEYAVVKAMAVADSLFWSYEREGSSLRIYHPTGGSILVAGDGTIDANNFTGGACVAAVEAIASGLGLETSRSTKPEVNLSTQSIKSINL
jgi:hypothetical protein